MHILFMKYQWHAIFTGESIKMGISWGNQHGHVPGHVHLEVFFYYFIALKGPPPLTGDWHTANNIDCPKMSGGHKMSRYVGKGRGLSENVGVICRGGGI